MTPSFCPILLVEDDPNDILLMQRAFERAGLTHPLDLARDGDEALAYLATLPDEGDGGRPLPVLVLLDVKLPRRSGLEVLERVRATPTIARVPVVVLSSSSHGPEVERAYALGANAFVVKPPSFDRLVALVRLLKEFWLGFNTPAPSPPAAGRLPSER